MQSQRSEHLTLILELTSNVHAQPRTVKILKGKNHLMYSMYSALYLLLEAFQLQTSIYLYILSPSNKYSALPLFLQNPPKRVRITSHTSPVAISSPTSRSSNACQRPRPNSATTSSSQPRNRASRS